MTPHNTAVSRRELPLVLVPFFPGQAVPDGSHDAFHTSDGYASSGLWLSCGMSTVVTARLADDVGFEDFVEVQVDDAVFDAFAAE